MPKSRKKKSPKRVLALPDLEQAKSAVLNSLSSLPAVNGRTTTPSTRSCAGTAASHGSHSIAACESGGTARSAERVLG